MKLAGRITVVLALLTALLGTGVAVATATVNPSWTGQIRTAGGTTSSATAVWNVKTHYLLLQLHTGTVATGRCVTVYFDWSSKGHHDSRALRDCRSADSVSYSFPDATPSNITGGPHKLGVCYAPADKLGVCAAGYGSHTTPMNWSPWPNAALTTPCDLSWYRRNADGTTSAFIDPHSQSAGFAVYRSC